jgi:hypothetical protein
MGGARSAPCANPLGLALGPQRIAVDLVDDEPLPRPENEMASVDSAMP